MRLLHLLISWDIVDTAILTEVRTCLLEVKRYIGSNTLFKYAEYPSIITDAGFRARLTADRHLLAPLSVPVNRGSGVSRRGKPSMEIYRAKQGLTNDGLVLYR